MVKQTTYARDAPRKARATSFPSFSFSYSFSFSRIENDYQNEE